MGLVYLRIHELLILMGNVGKCSAVNVPYTLCLQQPVFFSKGSHTGNLFFVNDFTTLADFIGKGSAIVNVYVTKCLNNSALVHYR